MKILNIHGYHGSPENSAYQALAALGCEITSPALYYDTLPPESVLERLKAMLADEHPGLIVGTSFGGFYAAVLSAECGCPVMLVNPFLMSFLSFEGDCRPEEHIRPLIRLFGSLSRIDTDKVSCIVGGSDELLGDHSFTEKLLGNERFRRIPGGGHSGHTLPLREYFSEMLDYYNEVRP